MGDRLLLFFGIVLAAQDDPLHLLRQVSQKVMETTNRMPKYVCTQTIDRTEYRLNGASGMASCGSCCSTAYSGGRSSAN